MGMWWRFSSRMYRGIGRDLGVVHSCIEEANWSFIEGSEYTGDLSVVAINCDSCHITVVGKSRYFDI